MCWVEIVDLIFQPRDNVVLVEGECVGVLVDAGVQAVPAGPAFQRREQFRDFCGVVVDPRMADEVKQAVIAIETKEQAINAAGLRDLLRFRLGRAVL